MLSKWIGCQRTIRNAKVDEALYLRWLRSRAIFNNIPVTTGYFDQSYLQFKTKINPWLKEVPSQILRNGIYRAKRAYVRYWAGVGAVPVRKLKSTTESVLITSELFQIRSGNLFLGSKTKAVKIAFNPHREFGDPKMITITRAIDEWYVSFTSSDDTVVPTNEACIQKNILVCDDEIVAIDRGVINPLYDSNGCNYNLSRKVEKKIEQLECKVEKFQRELHKHKIGSKRRNRTKNKLAKAHQKKRRVILDWRHKVSYSIASSDCKVVVVEDLKLVNMTKAPAAKPQTPVGVYPTNGAAAKAVLNRSMLKMGLGHVVTLLEYKLNRRGKALVRVNPRCSSQECSQCGHVHKDNRPTQDEFHCQSCGFKANADYNAALVLRKRGYAFLQSAVAIGNMETLNAQWALGPPEKHPA